jgi:SNF2 family DNA or RNA helicase
LESYEAVLADRRKIGPTPRDWSFHTKPYEHQQDAFNRLWGIKTGALFAGIGTGKTKIAVDLTNVRRVAGLTDSVLVLCPKSVRKSWEREIGVHSQNPGKVHLLKQTAKRQHDLFVAQKGEFRWYVVSIESLSTGRALDMAREFLLSCEKPSIVCDESHLIKNPSAGRTKAAQQLASACEFRLIMTGSPIANHVLDLYAQFEFLDSDIIGVRNYYDFRARYAVMGGYENRQIVGFRNVPELMEMLKPYTIEIRKEDVLDLPDVVYERRDIDLTTKQRKIYDTLKRDFGVEQVTVKSTIELMLRLQQVAGGFLAYESADDMGRAKWDVEKIDTFPKIKEILELADELTDRSFIVWCRFRSEIDEVAAALSEKGETVVLHGDINEEGRDAAVQAYRTGAARFLVANAATGGIGINGLQEQPGVMLFYSSSFSSVEREQAIGRVNRSGQVAPLTVVDLVAEGTVDEAVLAALSHKQDVAEYVKSCIGNRESIPGVTSQKGI